LNADQLFNSFCLGDHAGEDDNDENDKEKKPLTEEEEKDNRRSQFVKWLKKTFQPSHQHIFGDGQLNPVLFFHLTELSPGYVGGLISGLTYSVFF